MYTIVHSILHGQSAVDERSEIDIFSNYFEILKGELAGGVYFFYLLAILMLNSLMFWGKALTVTI